MDRNGTNDELSEKKNSVRKEKSGKWKEKRVRNRERKNGDKRNEKWKERSFGHFHFICSYDDALWFIYQTLSSFHSFLIPSLLQFFITLFCSSKEFFFSLSFSSLFSVILSSLTERVSFDLVISLGNEENLLTHFFHSRSFLFSSSCALFCFFHSLIPIGFLLIHWHFHASRLRWILGQRGKKGWFFLLPSFYLPFYRLFPSLKKGWEEAREWKAMRRLVSSCSLFLSMPHTLSSVSTSWKRALHFKWCKIDEHFLSTFILFFFLSHSKKKERNIVIKEKRNRHLHLFETGFIKENKSMIFPSMDRRMDHSVTVESSTKNLLFGTRMRENNVVGRSRSIPVISTHKNQKQIDAMNEKRGKHLFFFFLFLLSEVLQKKFFFFFLSSSFFFFLFSSFWNGKDRKRRRVIQQQQSLEACFHPSNIFTIRNRFLSLLVRENFSCFGPVIMILFLTLSLTHSFSLVLSSSVFFPGIFFTPHALSFLSQMSCEFIKLSLHSPCHRSVTTILTYITVMANERKLGNCVHRDEQKSWKKRKLERVSEERESQRERERVSE